MKLRYFLLNVIIIGVFLFSAGCSVINSFSPTETPTSTFTPTPDPTPTQTMTPTEIPFYLDATVFSGELQVPILIYHRFIPDDFGDTTATKMRLSDFQAELQAFYDSGFSLISLESWIDGTFIVPIGRKPLIVTLDDLWNADQLFINPDGTPSDNSGIGVLWNFSQSHPEFGFHAAFFSNMGDKYYADKQVGDRFILGDDDAWKDKLAETMIWAVDNGIEIYNHLYQHPKLDITENKDIIYQIRENDNVTRYFLRRGGREDLYGKLGNIIALPYGIWPQYQSGKDILLNYKDPDGKPLKAVMEAYNLDAAQLTPSYYSAGFNPFAIPRITASKYMVEYIVQNRDMVPTAVSCQLGPLQEDQSNNAEVISSQISSAIASGSCAVGVYHVNDLIFFADEGRVTLQEKREPSDPTPTPTFQTP